MPTFRRLVFFVFSAGAVCGLLGWLLAGAAPERWYARAVVQAGFSAQLNWESAQQLGQSMSPVAVAVEPVESPHEMLERVNMVSFRMDALHASQLADREDLADAMKHRFSARVLPAPKLLELRVRGADAEAPRQLLDALIAHLRAAHAKEIDPARRSIESLLAQRRAEEKALLRYVSELDPADLSRPEVLRNSFGSNAAFASLFVKGAQA